MVAFKLLKIVAISSVQSANVKYLVFRFGDGNTLIGAFAA
jgi:hypothetical protein